MKKTLIILLLLISISASAQKKEAWKVITVYSSSIILNAVGDGLNDSGHKDWGHACNAASIGFLLTSPFIIDYDKSKWGYYLTSYVGLRFAMFDASYNLSRSLPYNYVGVTAPTDKMLQNMPRNLITFSKGISLSIGIITPITKIKK